MSQYLSITLLEHHSGYTVKKNFPLLTLQLQAFLSVYMSDKNRFEDPVSMLLL